MPGKQTTTAFQTSPTRALAEFLASIRYESLPAAVVARAEELFLDWFASALAGKGAHPAAVIEKFSGAMGPNEGLSEILISRKRTSPFFAALVNGGASHFVEQDDLHNSSVLHPGTVVFPAVLAAAQDTGASGRALITAAVAGYECGVRVGEFLGRSHYKVFHTTGTAGKLAAAAGVAHLLELDADRIQHALGSAGTMAAGLWEFLRDAADSKQLHAAKAAADGLLAAYIARDGFTGAREILEGKQGMAAGMSSDADSGCLTDGLGTRWTLAETSFKFHASCRHTHPAADALLELMCAHELEADDITAVTAHVHQGALDVLGPVTDPRTIHQSKFSMGFVLALIALNGRAGLADFTEAALKDRRVRAFHDRVNMAFDPEIDRAYPRRWMGRVTVKTRDGGKLEQRVTSPKGDPDNTLTRDELEDKALRLASFAGGATQEEMKRVITRVWRLRDEPNVRDFLKA
ncbi:MAG: 2-methylcitrate dehydratase [Betaproteobacteria bacterium RIFCSPLOWO2_12_FULL_62_13]|nr:MAG: 2-methylcitrate dehydratase [Betaproteobacteria bacterium RIFCSPLOWO2_12_FULL_62_13]